MRRFFIYTMESIFLMYAVFLLDLCQMEGSRSVSPVFVQKGKDVDLEIREADVPEEYIALQWKFNGPQVIVTLSSGAVTVSDSYKGRADASVENFSVKLKNLQKADSGVYTAEVIATEKSPILAEYHITVEDPVSPVQLTVDSVSNSSDSCNFTATCITQDSHHINSTFICDTKACIQEGGERSKVTNSGDFLKIYLVNDLIICNHSNRVSWKNDTKNLQICPQETPVSYGKTIGVSMAVLVPSLVLCIPIFILCRRRNRENTIYEVPQDMNRAQTRNQNPTKDDSYNSPTLYSTVQEHTGPVRAPGIKTSEHLETVYAEVNKSKPTSPLQPSPEKPC